MSGKQSPRNMPPASSDPACGWIYGTTDCQPDVFDKALAARKNGLEGGGECKLQRIQHVTLRPSYALLVNWTADEDLAQLRRVPLPVSRPTTKVD
jgi:hypothetical protein